VVDRRRYGPGHGHDLTPTPVIFWFFDAANVEVRLEGARRLRAQQHFWVFAGGLTTVQVHLTVTDT